ncbi:hypothetical protein FHG87_017408 [Trinorchestia longiramus]|nr:hypothetical protein FHG87_017408 [Trinorchestia longiramus]
MVIVMIIVIIMVMIAVMNMVMTIVMSIVMIIVTINYMISHNLSFKSRDPSCRSELLQVYCSYQFHPHGLCLPPFAISPGQVNLVVDSGGGQWWWTVVVDSGGGQWWWTVVENPDPGALQPSFQQYPPLLDRFQFLEASSSRSGDEVVTASSQQRLPDNLRMVRLAFLILVHKDAEAVLHQLQLLYSPKHQFMYHVDKRQSQLRLQLTALIQRQFPSANNIRIKFRQKRPTWIETCPTVREKQQDFDSKKDAEDYRTNNTKWQDEAMLLANEKLELT